MDRRRSAITIVRGLAVIGFVGALLAVAHSALTDAARPRTAARYGSAASIVANAGDIALPPHAIDRRVASADDRNGFGRWELLRHALLATVVGVSALAAFARHRPSARAAAAARRGGRLRSTRAPPLVVV